MSRFSATTDFFVLSCADCSMPFAVTTEFEGRRRQDHGRFYCPVGHVNYWPAETDLEKERRLVQRLKQDQARILDERNAAVRQRDKAELALRKHRKRATAGLCPCCNRSFLNMQRHMKMQHPDYNVVPLKA